MVKLFEINGNHCYTDNPHVEKNVFITKEPDTEPLPVYEEIKDQLPRPIWDGHDSAIECRPAFPVSGDDRLVFCKHLSDGSFALLFVNGDEQDRVLSCITHDIGYTVGSGYKIHMRDILSGEEMIQGDFPEIKVPGYDCRIFKCKLVKD